MKNNSTILFDILIFKFYQKFHKIIFKITRNGICGTLPGGLKARIASKA